MIKHDLADLFRKNSVHKKFVINYDGGTITNSDLFMEEFSLEESICSEEELRFGSCEASVIRFPISNVFTSLNGKVLDVSVVLDHNEDKPLKIGKYKVASDVPTADRKRKDITAYDALYDVINADVADWYNTLLPNADSTVTFKQFRDSFFGYFGIEQVEVSLINDSMIVTKTIQPTELSGSMVANAICELNGCFGHINRDGLMDYVFLKGFTEAVYPSDDLYPAEDLFPEDSNYHRYTKSDYPSGGCDYQEYVVRKITGLEIRQEEESSGVFVGEKENPYVISDNFLTYGKSTEEMTSIAQNMLNVINGIEYRPFTLNTFRGNPCVEVGDGIKIYTDNQIIPSYVLNRTLTGIQALSDAFEANGKEYRTAQVNSVQSQITQLKGKANRLERTAESTNSRIDDLEKNIGTEIEQLSDSIALSIDENGNIVTDLTLDKNGMTFIGNYLVINAKNFSLDEDGDVIIKGDIDATILLAKDKIQMYDSAFAPIGTSGTPRTVLSWDDSNGSILYKPLLIGDGKTAVNINGEIGSAINCIEEITTGESFHVGGDDNGLYSDDNGWIVRNYVAGSNDVSTALGNNSIDTRIYGKNIYQGGTSTTITSDERIKKDFDTLEKYESLFFDLKPVSYKYKNGTSGRTHIGITGQSVKKSLEDNGLTTDDFAGYVEFSTDDECMPYIKDNVMCGVRDGEFVLLNTHMIQKSYKIIEQQQAEIDELKKSVSFLMEKLGGMANE